MSRTKRKEILLSEEEFKKLSRAASESGLNLSDFIRMAAIVRANEILKDKTLEK